VGGGAEFGGGGCLVVWWGGIGLGPEVVGLGFWLGEGWVGCGCCGVCLFWFPCQDSLFRWLLPGAMLSWVTRIVCWLLLFREVVSGGCGLVRGVLCTASSRGAGMLLVGRSLYTCQFGAWGSDAGSRVVLSGRGWRGWVWD